MAKVKHVKTTAPERVVVIVAVAVVVVVVVVVGCDAAIVVSDVVNNATTGGLRQGDCHVGIGVVAYRTQACLEGVCSVKERVVVMGIVVGYVAIIVRHCIHVGWMRMMMIRHLSVMRRVMVVVIVVVVIIVVDIIVCGVTIVVIAVVDG